MKSLATRIAQIAAALAVMAVFAFGGFQLQATAASLDHCHVVPGPDIHCNTVGDCSPECDEAQIVSCEPVPGGEKCCMCIF